MNIDAIQQAYDIVARSYAEQFADELTHKPLDRGMLREFASLVGSAGKVCDIGCGHGRTTAFLQGLGVDVIGIDLSTAMLEAARDMNPGVSFRLGNALSLDMADDSLAGTIAFYSIVHLTNEDVDRFLSEAARVLQPGGLLLLAFHTGSDEVHIDEFLGHSVSMDFRFFVGEDIQRTRESSGFCNIEATVRDPYPDVEYPSRRAYVMARTPSHDL